jgi:hypothetical protein
MALTFEEKRDRAVATAREKRAINRAIAEDRESETPTNKLPNISAPKVKMFQANTFHNGFPPADDMIVLMAIIVLIGNAARGKGDATGYVKIIGASFMLAIVLGLADRGAMASPVRALAALMLLTASLYYIPYILNGINGGAPAKSQTMPSGPTKTIGKGPNKVTTPANKFSQGL